MLTQPRSMELGVLFGSVGPSLGHRTPLAYLGTRMRMRLGEEKHV